VVARGRASKSIASRAHSEASLLPLTVPSHYGVWLHDDEGLLPPRPEPRERDPECAIEWLEPRLRFLLIVGGKLLAKGEFDDHLLAVAAKESRNASHDERQEMEWSLQGGRDTGGVGAAIRV
jgi:hypothetical protein